MVKRSVFALLMALAVLPARAEDLLAIDDQMAPFDVCFDFGCKSNHRIYLSEADWQPVYALLANSPSAEQERKRISRAIALMESIVGMVSPTGADRAGNEVPDSDQRGQMDCIDESTNATTYLQMFEQSGLLRWHRVREPVFRAPLLVDEHWAAQIEELRSGSRYAVDSWPRAHSTPAVVQSIDEWLSNVEPPAL